MNKVRYALALGAMLAGCVSQGEPYAQKKMTPLQRAGDLGIVRPVVLGNGYVAEFGAEQSLLISSGIVAGSVQSMKTPKGYAVFGSFSRFENEPVFDEVCRRADHDKDMIITLREAKKTEGDAVVLTKK